jgi:hypothetical protein
MRPLPLRLRQRRVAFFFDDYIDTDSRILEIGPGDGWLGAYLVHAGFLRYRRLHSQPPADIVGHLRDWRELGLEPASGEILIAFDGLPTPASYRDCWELLVPGGRLFVVAPIPGRRFFARALGLVGLRRPNLGDASPLGLERLRGFVTRKLRRAQGVDLWVTLQRPLDSSSELRVVT